MPDPHFSNTPAYFKEIASGDTPSSGQVALYAKSDGKMYYKDDAGVETEVGGGGVAGTVGVIDNVVPRADGTGGETLQNSNLSVSDTGVITTFLTSDPTRTIILTPGVLASIIGQSSLTVTTGGGGLTLGGATCFLNPVSDITLGKNTYLNNNSGGGSGSRMSGSAQSRTVLGGAGFTSVNFTVLTSNGIDANTRTNANWMGFITGTGANSSTIPAGNGGDITFDLGYGGNGSSGQPNGSSGILIVRPQQGTVTGTVRSNIIEIRNSFDAIMTAFRSGGGIALSQIATAGTPDSNTALIYSKDVGGTAEMFVMDEAGNETQISPHSHNAPQSLIDNSYDEVGYSANYYTGIITWTNRTRETSGKPNSRQFETFEEYNIRLNESMVQWDWDTVQSDHVAKSKEQHDIWIQRKSEWESNENNIDKPFEEKEPDIITAKPQPQWLVDQLANREDFLAQRNAIPPVEMWQVKVWLARKNISLSTVSEILSTKIPEGPEREEALIRWEYVTVVPYDNILVGLIASELNLDKETAWREISSI